MLTEKDELALSMITLRSVIFSDKSKFCIFGIKEARLEKMKYNVK